MKKNFDHQEIDKKWYKSWIENKTFSAKPNNNKPFTIVIPPPNVTGHLHMGHALNNILQDTIIRFRKLQGYNTLWVPGTDHGGIATQNIVEKLLKKNEGKTKHDLGRERFLQKMLEWRIKTGDVILDQLKKLGCSLDWDRLAFTMDESRSKAVKKAFIQLFNKGLIYKRKRLVNWCSKCATALSDVEVEYEYEKSNLWYIKYPLINFKGFIVVATTRPETIFGDTALAVNSEDRKYTNLIGKSVKIPLIDREVKIITDSIVDKSFGTGVVKVTPAHDASDNEIARRNKLEIIEIIDINGKMINVPSKYQGLNVEEARIKVIEDLYAENFLVKIDDYDHSVGKCYRCSTKIESLMSEQWFLDVRDMSKRAIEAANNEKIFFHPQSWKKSYILWLENLRDWCISRQIWWGHRIPVYYCISEKNDRTNCEPIASFDKPKECPYCKRKKIIQDEDVLDTWFSSALWPISVFNWGEDDDNKELKYFYPTSVLVTGHEILYLWVARMVQFGIEFMKEIPYDNIFIHGIIRDGHGKKMSKSLANVVDPLKIMDQYGTDALRFALTQAATPGRDMQISNTSFLAARNFINKIWNASRFVILNLKEVDKLNNTIQPIELSDKWIITEFINSSRKIKKAYESYNIDNAVREIYDFFWTKYCDWYIEFSKIRITSTNLNIKKQVLSILVYILKSILQLMSPIIPFITSEIWQILNKNEKIIAESLLFSIPENFYSKSSIYKMNTIQDIITKIRTLRSEMNIPPTMQIEASFNTLCDNNKIEIIRENKNYIKQLAKIKSMQFYNNIAKPKNSAVIIMGDIEIFLPLEGFIDLEKEKARLTKEIIFTNQEIEKLTLKLNNESFIKKAPATEIEKTKIRLDEAKLKIEKINKSLNSLI